MEQKNYKVYYSFLHRNENPYLAETYRVFREDNGSGWNKVAEHLASKQGDPVLVTGMDVVNHCNVEYNYKVSAFNDSGEIFCINPLVSGVIFPCPI